MLQRIHMFRLVTYMELRRDDWVPSCYGRYLGAIIHVFCDGVLAWVRGMGECWQGGSQTQRSWATADRTAWFMGCAPGGVLCWSALSYRGVSQCDPLQC